MDRYFPQALTAIATLTNNNRRGSNSSVRSTIPTAPLSPGRHARRGRSQSARHQRITGTSLLGNTTRTWIEPDFEWEIFVALPATRRCRTHGSDIDGDKFGSPDGIYVAPSGRLWIQTDVSTSTINAGEYAGFGHNQMLCADPETGEIRRFLVGPKQCEITGVFVTPDERAMFVGIQHPGETADELAQRPGQSEGIQLLARRRRRRTSALGLHCDHQG